MSKNRSLTLIAPYIAASLAQAAADRVSSWPQLARLAGRASIATAWQPDGAHGHAVRPWQAALLAALGLQGSIGLYPSAAVTRTGDTGRLAAGFWMQAEPMHFAAGLDRLNAVFLHGESRVSAAERAELGPRIAAHLQASGLELSTTSTGDWLVHSERAIEVRTAAPETAVSSDLHVVMPQGRDAGQLRRTMTELQMLLHEHPVNLARARRGAPEINAVWFHGEGSIERGTDGMRSALPAAFGNEPYLRGIYHLHGQSLEAAPSDAKALLPRLSSNAVAVIDAADLDTLETLWMAPLARALRVGAISTLELVLDHWQLTIPRIALLRIWRSARPPVEWIAC